MLDTLLFLFLTIFFVIKLRGSFGFKDDDDDNERARAVDEFLKSRYKKGSDTSNDEANMAIDITTKSSHRSLRDLPKAPVCLSVPVPPEVGKEITRYGFDENVFLKGAETAVELVSDSLSSQDFITLQKLLSDKMFLVFKKQVDDLSARGQAFKVSLVSVLSKKIVNIELRDAVLVINVLFETEQINFIEDKDGTVLRGNKKKINKTLQQWTFARSPSGTGDFWVVDAVEAKD